MKQHSLNVFIQLLHINVNALEVRIKVFFKDKNFEFSKQLFYKDINEKNILKKFNRYANIRLGFKAC